MINAADYPVWRNSLGQTGMGLPADGTGDDLLGTPDGIVDQFDYEFWKLHYGESIFGSGAFLANGTGNVPEPSSFAMLILAILVCAGRRGARAEK